MALMAFGATIALGQLGGQADTAIVPNVARDSDEGARAAPGFGVAGLIPPRWPAPTEADWTLLFERLPEYGGMVGVYTNWADSAATQGMVPQAIAATFQLANERGVLPVVAIGTTRDLHPGIESTVDWEDAAQRANFVRAVTAIAEQYEPRFLIIGGEINRLWETDPRGFDAFVAGYVEARVAAKAASPETLVFPTFQLEMMKGDAFLAGGSDVRDPQWHLLERFAGTMDVAAFTTYPFLDYEAPGQLPNDYYAEVATHTELPVALTEVGWPSEPLSESVAPYGGSPAEQREFVERYLELTGFGVAFSLWAFPHDPGTGAPELFRYVSLRENGGAAKPALAIWREASR